MADRVTLQAGDVLCFFTDGVTEADNGNEMFGSKRLQAALLPSNTPIYKRLPPAYGIACVLSKRTTHRRMT